MTVELSVADVREALVRASSGNGAGSGEAATLTLGRIFHEVFADLVSTNRQRSGLRVIAESGPNTEHRTRQLLEHTWRKLLCPRLVSQAAVLQDSSQQVLVLWRATRSLVNWLVAVGVELLGKDPKAVVSWERLGSALRAEVPLGCELREPGWSDSVRLAGVADSILRPKEGCGFCAIELKLGRGAPTVDLGQAALYHLILTRSGEVPVDSALALLRFTPDLDEHLLPAQALEEAERRLVDLVGRLAGVAQETPASSAAALVSAAPASEAHADLGRRLQEAYREQGLRIELRGEPLVGPRFLRFDVRLATGTRIDALRRCTPEIQHRLELKTEPAVVKHAGRVYVDVARPDPQTVLFSGVSVQLPKIDPLRGSARMPVGVDPGGQLHFADLASSGRSHVLVAGATGSGKSEWLRMTLAGLFASNTPDTLRVVALDPKLSAFSDLERSSFLWKEDSFWIPGARRCVTELFDDVILEMERRYKLAHDLGADSLAEYVEKTGKPMPRIILVCDEYFALVSSSKDDKKQIEADVSLLGAKSRAAGIHLVLATQQPSRATISGVIQTNLPCRVALTLQSPIESKMMLNMSGAEKLTFSGDLLYKDFGDPVRLQAPYLPEDERRHWLRK